MALSITTHTVTAAGGATPPSLALRFSCSLVLEVAQSSSSASDTGSEFPIRVKFVLVFVGFLMLMLILAIRITALIRAIILILELSR